MGSSIPLGKELPEGWTETPLIDLLDALESGSRPRGGVRGIKEGIPSVGGEHVNDRGGFDFSNVKFVPKSFAKEMNRGKIQLNDVLIVKDGATTGKVSFVDESFPFREAFVNEHVFINRPKPELNPKCIFYYLFSKEGQDRILENYKGTAQGGINQTFAPNTSVPLPPLPEQNRIVYKLDQILPRVEACKTRLENIPKLLKSFRQGVISSACNGDLTQEWRENHKSENSRNLLSSLITKRKNLWESRSVSKYKEPLEPLIPEEHEIPDTWVWASVSQISILDVGFAFKSSDFKNEGIRLLRGENLMPGSLRWEETRYLHNSLAKDYKYYSIEEGEIILALDRPLISTGLKIAKAKKSDLPCLLVQRVMRFKMVDMNNTDYLYLALSNSRFSHFLNLDGMTGTQVPHITGTGVSEFAIPFPPLKEQAVIVRRVEALFALADRLEAQYQKAKAKVDKTTQSVLAKAFRGELVPQDPKDEPASVLLDRIKAQKETSPDSRKKPKGKLSKVKV